MQQTIGASLIPIVPRGTTSGVAAAASQAVTVGRFSNARIAAIGQAVWVKLSSGVSAATVAGPDCFVIPAGSFEYVQLGPDRDTVNLIEDAASAKWSVTIF